MKSEFEVLGPKSDASERVTSRNRVEYWSKWLPCPVECEIFYWWLSLCDPREMIADLRIVVVVEVEIGDADLDGDGDGEEQWWKMKTDARPPSSTMRSTNPSYAVADSDEVDGRHSHAHRTRERRPPPLTTARPFVRTVCHTFRSLKQIIKTTTSRRCSEKYQMIQQRRRRQESFVVINNKDDVWRATSMLTIETHDKTSWLLDLTIVSLIDSHADDHCDAHTNTLTWKW